MNKALLVFLSGMMLMSCGEDQTAQTEKAPEPQIKSVETVDPKVQKLEDLKKMPALGLDGLQKYLPESLAEIRRSQFSMTSNLGYSTVQADYEKGKTAIHMVLYDCSGDSGSDIYKTSFQDKLDKTDSTETGFTQTIDLGGRQAIEQYNSQTKVTTLSFMINDQVMAVMAGKGIEPDALKEAAASIKS